MVSNPVPSPKRLVRAIPAVRERLSRIRLLLTGGVILLLTSSASAQEVRYIYDALGQLIGVVDQTGKITIYEYDEVGNLLTVRRPDVTNPGPVTITFVNPNTGPAGTTVEIFGIGFSLVAGENQIAFNGTPAPVLSASRTRLLTQVPNGATTGLITVTTPLGSAASPDVFRVPRIAISPTQTKVIAGKQRQFSATVTDASDQRVAWSVNGIEGGSLMFGTITAEGLYSAPAELPTPPEARVQVSSVPFPTLVAEANVAIVPPPPSAVIATPIDIRVVRPGIGDPGGLALNVTVAAPPSIQVVRPGSGDPGGLPINVTVAAPPLISVVRPGTGDPGGQPLNITVAAPPAVLVVRPGTGDPNGLVPNVTVAQPPDIQVKRE